MSKSEQTTGTPPAPRAGAGAKTGAQSVGFSGLGGGSQIAELTSLGTLSLRELRHLRRQPTLHMIRDLTEAIVEAGQWTVEANDDVPDGMVALVRRVADDLRAPYIEASVFGLLDFGRISFETVWETQDQPPEADALDGSIGVALVPIQLKPLLPDLTTVLVDDKGQFQGVRQKDAAGRNVDLSPEECIHLCLEREGTNYYGESAVGNAHGVFQNWNDANGGAARYDRKVAGAHFLVEYPPGKSIVNGAEKQNELVAQEILDALESSGSVMVPQSVATELDRLVEQSPQWKITLLEDRGGRQPTFIDRLKYLDTLFVRALNFPERAILEGQFGTKAEAGQHADTGMAWMEKLNRMLAEGVNRGAIRPMIRANFGPTWEHKLGIKAAPLADAAKEFLQRLYLALVGGLNAGDEIRKVDTDGLKDALGIPKADVVAQAGEEEEPGRPTEGARSNGEGAPVGGPRSEDGSREGETSPPPGRAQIDSLRATLGEPDILPPRRKRERRKTRSRTS